MAITWDNTNETAVYMIIADGQCDQIVDDLTIAKREKRDLEKMGCEVRIRIFREPSKQLSWAKAEAYETKLRG